MSNGCGLRASKTRFDSASRLGPLIVKSGVGRDVLDHQPSSRAKALGVPVVADERERFAVARIYGQSALDR